jgi:hypothetical protein
MLQLFRLNYSFCVKTMSLYNADTSPLVAAAAARSTFGVMLPAADAGTNSAIINAIIFFISLSMTNAPLIAITNILLSSMLSCNNYMSNYHKSFAHLFQTESDGQRIIAFCSHKMCTSGTSFRTLKNF